MDFILKSLIFFYLFVSCFACTNILVTQDASVEGNNMISYNADSHVLYGALYHWPAGSHKNGTMMDIHDWDSGVYLGQIAQAPITYNVVGNSNEFGLAITETTFGGLEVLSGTQTQSVLDYGSLIYTTLQRSRNVKEAISTIDELTKTYGWRSEGESFSLADPNEVWVMDIIGKGPSELGAVWVARKVPNGYVCSHANQARITTFPRNNPSECLYSEDVVSFAKKMGFYAESASDEDFSFSDVYDPINPSTARSCEARVWYVFSQLDPSIEKEYLNYARGYDLSKRMPLWIKPVKKVALQDVMNLMRNHFENSYLEFDQDVGAEAWHLPYRHRPLTWNVESNTNLYTNERSAGTQQTGFTLVAELRHSKPQPLAGILWFGLDDSDSSVYAPMYSSMNRVPLEYDRNTASIMKFSLKSAFWIFNMVTNFAYTRYSVIHPEIQSKIQYYENKYQKEVKMIDQKAESMYKNVGKSTTIQYLTNYSVKTGSKLVSDWWEFYQYLFTKYMDFNIKTPNTDPKNPSPIVNQPGYDNKWRSRIAAETGDHYVLPSTSSKEKLIKLGKI